MKKTTLAAVLIVLCGGLAACGPKPEPAAPVEEVQAPLAPEPMPMPAPMEPATDEGMEGHDGMEGHEGMEGHDGMDGDETDEITPHAGGDKVTPST